MRGGDRSAFKAILKKHRREVVITLIATFVASLCESVGILAILPVLQALSSSNPTFVLTESSGKLSQILQQIEESIGLGGTLIFVGTMIASKAMLNLGALRTVTNIMARMNANYRAHLVNAVIKANWIFFISQPAGKFVNALIGEIPKATGIFKASIDTIAKALEAAVLLTFSFLIAPQLSFIAVVAGVAFWFALGRFTRIAREQGSLQVKILNRLSSSFADALQGIKSIKVMSREKWLENVLERDALLVEEAVKKQLMSKHITSIMREPIIAVFLLLGIYGFMKFSPTDFPQLLTMIVLFYRATTALSGIQQSYQQLGSLESSYWFVRDLINEAESHAEPEKKDLSFQTFANLELQRLNFNYRSSEPVLVDLDLKLEKGSIVALVGKSGSGKSTFADILCGLLKPSSGSLRIDGGRAPLEDLISFRCKLGYVPQDLFLFHDTIRQNLTLGDTSISDQEIWKVLENVGAEEFVSKLSNNLETVVGERGLSLSGGQRQRLSIARAMLRRPEILVLDEPTTALDTETEGIILKLLLGLKDKVAVLAISHQPGILGIANRIYRLEGGKIAEIHQNAFQGQ